MRRMSASGLLEMQTRYTQTIIQKAVEVGGMKPTKPVGGFLPFRKRQINH